ncbi:DUF3987 domain-containing protein [Roseomonas terrae]|jgi:hypothetical protein|uniref:DUF3987 domain-containing protein n=1 Tax=Neoroseomonas terrae TaxID=424799 RepID=A0ABS5EPU9_9PROT|nr:DUF3987 domain-containing protein [Neoroseomonas terrae]
MLDGIGMLARVLLVAPESTVGTRFYREAPEACATSLATYRRQLGALLRRAPATRADDNSVLAPHVMTLSPDARALWIRFSDHMEREAGPGGAFAPIRAWAAKAAEHAGRLAAALTLYADDEAMDVPADLMSCGIALAQHYALEMLRLACAARTSADLRLASRLLAWWQQRPTPPNPANPPNPAPAAPAGLGALGGLGGGYPSELKNAGQLAPASREGRGRDAHRRRRPRGRRRRWGRTGAALPGIGTSCHRTSSRSWKPRDCCRNYRQPYRRPASRRMRGPVPGRTPATSQGPAIVAPAAAGAGGR